VALIQCPECLVQISDQTDSCPKCGYPIKKDKNAKSKSESAKQDGLDNNKSKKGKWLFLLLGILACLIIIAISVKLLNKPNKITPLGLTTQTQDSSGGIWQKQTSPLLNGSIIVKAGEWRSFEFSTNANWTNINVSGSLKASGGTGNDIRVLILTKIDFENLINGHSSNGVVKNSEAINSAWAEIESQLLRRNVLIPNLVSTIEGYATHEKELFKHIDDARARLAGAGSIGDKMAASNELSGFLSRLIAISENYPQLKANENFLQLQDELAGIENRINYAKSKYNELVKANKYYYDSGQITVAKLNVSLPSITEDYVLMFSNAFSTVSAKEVNGHIDFGYSYWQVE
jgi:hypothetical protein